MNSLRTLTIALLLASICCSLTAACGVSVEELPTIPSPRRTATRTTQRPISKALLDLDEDARVNSVRPKDFDFANASVDEFYDAMADAFQKVACNMGGKPYCMNGGECSFVDRILTCTCPPNFYGNKCEKKKM